MANQSLFISQRAGDWSVPSNVPTSPWYSADTAALTGTPSTADATADAGWCVQIDHPIRIDVDATVGGSYQAAGWAPLTVSSTAGSTVTALADGTYRVAYQVQSPRGLTAAGNSESALFTVKAGQSKPRVTLPAAPPSGCTYSLYLTDVNGNSGWERLYCDLISDVVVDLGAALWGNSFVNGGVSGGTSPWTSAVALLPYRLASAITIGPKGSITVAAGKTLTLRGDIWIASKDTSAADYITLEYGAALEFDPSQAQDAAAARYVTWFQGGGRVRFMGPG